MAPFIGRRLMVGFLFATSLARAEQPASARGTTGARRVEFQACHVELEPGKERLELDGHVAIAVDRYRLTSERLSLERGPRGVVVTGSGRVALCPCPDPPITFGFQSATVAPPTDLLLEQPTIRAFGLPVFWLPYLWLRAPSRVGLLPLRVAYRGADGFLLGSGVHLPLGESSALDLTGAGYLRGGAEVGARLATARTTTDLGWDYVRSGAVRADLRGSLKPDGGAQVAWSVDALRGERALGGPSSIEEVALRQDRAAVFAGFSGDGAHVGLLGMASTRRGGPVGAVDAVGPGVHAGFGAPLGESVSVDADVGVATISRPRNEAVTLLSQQGELRGDAHAGPVVLSGEVRTRLMSAVGAVATGHAAVAGAGTEVAVPFVKTFGANDSPMQHWVTPFVAGLGGISDTAGPSVVPPLVGDGVFYVASGGLRSTLGETSGRRSAISVSARGGILGEEGQIPQTAVAWTARAHASALAISAEGVSRTSRLRGDALTSEVRVGPEDGPYLGGRATSSVGSVPLESRLLSGGWDAPFLPWFGRTGWSVGGRAGVPWTRWLTSSVDADYDLTGRTLLSVRGTVGYRHPCGCLAVTLWGGHRLGREGVDSWVTVDLAR
ncbi:MAG TPA: hypothetical protein VF395_20205 [Polyangiaceae bacterium]